MCRSFKGEVKYKINSLVSPTNDKGEIDAPDW